MNEREVLAVADAILHEGYLLYPYRATAVKNQYRWTMGLLTPKAWSERGGEEPWWLEAQCLIEGTGEIEAGGTLRFLRLSRRTVEAAVDGLYREVPSLTKDGRSVFAWEEGEVESVPIPGIVDGAAVAAVRTFELRPSIELADAEGGRIVHRRAGLRGGVHARLERVGPTLRRLTVRVENVTPWSDEEAPRDVVVASSLISAHLVLHVSGGAFVSLLDPPPHARDAAAACRNVRTHPVLAGGADDVVLSTPVIMYDHPRIAPESQGDFYDATEIDELLTLRTLTLTDEEKRIARETDARAARILDRVEAISNEDFARLHGARRDPGATEMVPLESPRPRFVAGRRVVLRPGKRRADATDLLFAGRTATIEKVVTDTEGREMVAVTIDDDPAAEMQRERGFFHYYHADEVEVLTP